MGWFDEQLKERNKKDNENFEEAFLNIAGSVMGSRVKNALLDKESAGSALNEIFKYLHIKYEEKDYPPGIKTDEDKIDFRLRPTGVMRREVLLEDKWYNCAVGPLLGTFKEDGRIVALIPGKFSGYYFFDPKTGKKTGVNRKNNDLFDKEATCFYVPLPLRSLTVKDLLVFMAERLSLADIVLYVACMGISALLGLINPMITKWLFGDVLNSGNPQILGALFVFLVTYSISRICFGVYQSLIDSRVFVKQDMAVEAAVMMRILSLPSSFFKNYSSGELSQRASYVNSLCSTLMNSIMGTGLTSVFSLIYIGQIFAFAPTLVVPALIITLCTVAFSIITTFAQMKITKNRMEASSKESGMSYSMITGIQKIKLSGAEKRMFSRWAKLYSKAVSYNYNPPAFLKLTSTINTTISLVGTFVMYFVAVNSHISVSDYYAFNASYGMVSGAFFSLASIASVIANFRPTLEMAKPVLEAVPENNENKEIITSIHGGIELNNVYFRYDKDQPYVIDGLSLKINPGEYVAIVGKTGCGKSTLLRLLLGFEKLERGEIAYDKKNIDNIDMKSLRRKIGVVMQNGKLFLGDIYSNIVISAPQLLLKDAWEAAEIASIADDIREMPMGMNTMICEGQGGISGGQKQRLMIARAVAPKPRILMFDEATSALDNITQKKVSEAIDSLKCTRIVIAHRLSTIRNADRIVVLDQGKIVEDGTYDQLILNNGFFADLVARQRLDINEQ